MSGMNIQKMLIRSSVDSTLSKTRWLKNRLEDRELSDWHNNLSALKERKPLFEKVSEALQSIADSIDRIDKLGES